MATIVQGVAVRDATGTTNQSTITSSFVSTPTSGNLLVMYYGARDSDNNETPAFTMPSGWTKVAESTPMEYHRCGIAWRTSDGADTGPHTITLGANVNSWWLGLVEFNQSGVSSWQLDKASSAGSGSTSVSSIATGSTGTLASAVGVAAVVGTSRTAAEGLTTDVGTSLSGTDANFEVDAGSANFLAAWQNLFTTSALNATITESGGASRMGAGIAVFIEASGGTDATVTPSVVTAVGSVPAATASGSVSVTPGVVTATGEVLTSNPSSSVDISATIVEGVGDVPTVTASGSVSITPDVVTALGVVDVAAGTASVSAFPNAVTAVGSIPTSTPSMSINIASATITSVGQVGSPVITADGAATVTAVVVTAVGDIPAVTVEAGSLVTTSVVTATGDVVNPSLSTGSTISPATITSDGHVLTPRVGDVERKATGMRRTRPGRPTRLWWR